MNEIALLLTLALFSVLTFHPTAWAMVTGWFKPEKKERDKKGEGTALFKKGGGGGSAPSPDPNIGKAAMKQAELGESWLEFAKEQFQVGNERQEKMDALTEKVTGEQLTSMEKQNQWALEDRDRYKDVFQPMEDQFIDDAKNWDSAERQEKMAAEAKADVLGNADAQRQAMERQQASMGVNPKAGDLMPLPGGIGSMVGSGIGIYGALSSRKLKENKKPIKGSALKVVRRLPIEEWQYKKGVADEGKHIGTYAEDFKKETGKGDGLTIPMPDAIGLTIKAVQELDEKIEKEKRYDKYGRRIGRGIKGTRYE